MKKLFILALGSLYSLAVLAQKEMNDANAEKRNVSGFHAINVSSAFDVVLSQGNEDAVAVSASEKEYVDKISTTVENGVLKIRFEDKKIWKNMGRMKLKAYISFKNLDALHVSGACNIKVEGTIKSESLKLHFSGASDMDGKLDVKDLDVHLSGASDITLNGVASNMKVDVSGASDFKGYDLQADYCQAEASGASSVKVTVNRELSARATGASEVGYKGNGVTKDIKTSGASNISKRS
jgi:hypothetical protein